jgi:autotransporter-associated beta strand protein
MKNSRFFNNSRVPFALTSAIAAMLATQTAHAVVYYWDNNGTTAGYGSAGGTWASPTVSQWSTSTDGTGTPGASITTTGSDALNFGNGATGLGTGTINVTGTQNAASLIFATGSGNIMLSGGSIGSLSNITVNGSSAATISSNINGANINKNGTGTLTLSGAKTYTGTFRLDTGTLILDETGTWGTGTLNFFNNTGNPTLQTTASSTKILSNRIFLGSATTNISGAQSFEFTGLVNNRGTNAVLFNDITGVGKTLTFSNTLGLNNGAGTANLTLSGSGTTNITGVIVDNITDGGAVSGAGGTNQLIIGSIGTVTLSGANTYGGATTIRGGGTTVLNYGTSDTSKLSDSTALTLGGTTFGGGTLTLKGATGSHVETVSATTLSAGGTFLTRDVNGGANTLKLRMNVITRAAGGTISFGDATLADTDTNNFGASGVNAILGGWATLGNDWAVSANTGAADTTITALASYTTFVNNVGSSTANYLLNGGDALGGATAIGSLKITNSSNSQTLNLGNNNLTVTSTSATALGGIMYAGGNDNLYTIGNGGGTGRIVSSTANQELIFAVQTGTLSVSAFVGLSGASSPVTKSGAGTMEISSANDFTGAVRVNQGVLRLANATASGNTAGGIIVQNGAALELANGVAVGNEALTITGTGISSGGALRNVASSTASYAGAITINFNGARINSDSSGALTLSGGIVTAVNRNVTIGGAGNTTVQTVAISGAGNLIKADAGTATLTFANTYTGATNVTGGTLAINGSGSINASSGVTVAAGAKLIYNSSAALTSPLSLSGAGTSSRAILGGTGTINTSVTLDNLGDTLSPGNSPGIQNFTPAQTWSSFSYDWEVNNFTGTTAGSDFDQIGLSSTLNLSGGSGSYILNILSLTAVNAGGNVPNFSEINRSWTILSTISGITGFNAASWSINTTNFTNTNTGAWAIAQSGNDLVLSYTAVPEPNVTMLLGSMGLLALLRRWR